MIPAHLLAKVALHTHNPVVISDAQGLTLWVNPAFEAATGYKLDQVRGRKPGEVLQGPQTDPGAVQRLSRALAQGEAVVSQEILNYRQDGQAYWVELDITPVRDEHGELTHFISIQVPLADRRRAQQAIADLSERLGTVLQAARLGVWEARSPGEALLLDAQARALLALPDAADAQALPWSELPPELAHWHAATQRAAQQGGEVDLQAWIKVPGGATRALRITGHRVADGDTSRVLGVIGDETAEREARARAEAEALDAMLRIERQDVLGRLRREFRLPLNSLLGFAQLLRAQVQRSGPEGLAQRIEHIESAGLRLLDMLDELLVAAGDAPGQHRSTLQPVQLQDLLGRHLPREVAVVEPEGGLHNAAVWADPTLLRRALNLAGGLGLHAGGSGSGPRLEVLPLAGSPHFELRFHYPPAAVSSDAGTGTERGLRVDLIQRLLRDMGGECLLVDEGQGLRMSLRLRMALGLQDDDETAVPPLPPAAPPAQVWATRRDVVGQVLYVEDDQGNVAVVEHALRTRPGVQLRVAADADSAQALLAQDPLPALLLIDLVLPGRSGRELLQGLREDPRLSRLPCVVLTSIDDVQQESELRAIGADEYLVKPLRLDRLLSLVDRYVGGAAAAQA